MNLIHRHCVLGALAVATGCVPVQAPIQPDASQDAARAEGEQSVAIGDAGTSDTSASSSPDSGVPVNPAAPEPCNKEGETRCALAAGAREVCSAGLWVATDPCGAGTVCTTSQEGVEGACLSVADICRGSSNQAVCDGQGTLVMCGSNAVAAGMTKCASARHCQLGLATQTCAVCVPGGEDGFKCEGATLSQCTPEGAGYTLLETCGTEALCNATAGACTMGACSEGQVRCEGDLLQKCNVDFTGFDMLEMCGADLCDAQTGVCDACVPGFAECQDASTARKCSEDGAELVMTPCPAETPFCVGSGKCVQCQGDEDCEFVCRDAACAGECKPGDVQCTDLVPETCDAKGTWQAGTPCPNVCSAGKCTGTCMPGTMQCSGTTPEMCSDEGSWVAGPITEKVCKAECTPGESKQRCDGTTPQTCTSRGTLMAGRITAGTCEAECTPGTESECDGTTKLECTSSGTYRRTANAVPDCADCRTGDDQCDRPRMMHQICQNGRWRDDGVTMECGAQCTPGGPTDCDEVTHRRKTCSNSGMWNMGEVTTDCGAQCDPGASGCQLGSNEQDWCFGSCQRTDSQNSGLAVVTCRTDGTVQAQEYCERMRCEPEQGDNLWHPAKCISNGTTARCDVDAACVAMSGGP